MTTYDSDGGTPTEHRQVPTGAFIKRGYWIPADGKAGTHDNPPQLVITSRINHYDMHQLIREENPPYPVIIKAPFDKILGLQIRGYTERLVRPDDWRNPQYKEWIKYHVECRVMPKGCCG